MHILPSLVRWSVLLLIGFVSLRAQNLQEFEKKVTEFRLSNGMKFIVLERHAAPVVAFNAFVNAGSVDDPAGKSSMAHMFEHMIGKGTTSVGTKNWAAEEKALKRVEAVYDQMEAAKVQKADEAKLKRLEAELKDAIESANAYVDANAYTRVIDEEGGVGFNAGTARDYTTYFYSLPANKTELWFLLSSEWFRRPVFREFYKERDVVREERRMRVESSTQGKLLELLSMKAFTVHPYGNFIGWANEIEALRATDAEKFYQNYYAPGNVTVAVVGDVTAAQVKGLAEKYFASLPSRPETKRTIPAEPKQNEERRATLESASQPFLIVGYKRPEQTHKDDPVFDVISSILSSGRTGWLYTDMVRDKKLALAAQAINSFPGGKYPNLFVLYDVPAAGKSVEDNERALYEQIKRLQNEKVDAATLERVKTKIRAGLIRQLDSNTGLSAQLPEYEVAYGNWRVMFTSLKDIEKVTAEDVQRVAKTYLIPEGRTVAYTVPPAAKGSEVSK